MRGMTQPYAIEFAVLAHQEGRERAKKAPEWSRRAMNGRKSLKQWHESSWFYCWPAVPRCLQFATGIQFTTCLRGVTKTEQNKSSAQEHGVLWYLDKLNDDLSAEGFVAQNGFVCPVAAADCLRCRQMSLPHSTPSLAEDLPAIRSYLTNTSA